MIVPIAATRLYLSQRRDGALSSASLVEEFGGGENRGFGAEAVAPSQGRSRGPLPSSTPGHRYGGGASPAHREHPAHTPTGSAHHHPLAARPMPAPRPHGGATTPGHHVPPSPGPDVSPHAFASGMGATMPAPAAHEPTPLYPSQQGALNVRNQAANARLAKVNRAPPVAVSGYPQASTPRTPAPAADHPTAGDPRGLRGHIREQAIKHGVNPDTAVKVAEHEGLRDFLGDYDKKSGVATSAGAFQLHKGGLADQFQKDTGLDPFDPKNERATIDWSVAHAGKTKSWQPWHGARRAGIGEHEGFISGEGASPSSGGSPATLSAAPSIPLSGGALGRADSLTGMHPEFRARLAAMFRDAPPGSSVFSGYRSPELQRQLYNAPHRPGYVARPGHSHHGTGEAADLRGNLDWFHKHAHEYGLRFPMAFEPWHIQSDPNQRVPVPQGNSSVASAVTPRSAPTAPSSASAARLAAARQRLARRSDR